MRSVLILWPGCLVERRDTTRKGLLLALLLLLGCNWMWRGRSLLLLWLAIVRLGQTWRLVCQIIGVYIESTRRARRLLWPREPRHKACAVENM